MARVYKVVRAEYDAALNALRLDQPLDGVSNHQEVIVTVETPLAARPEWRKMEGSLSGEAGESLARSVEEMFPIERE